jgi:TetR/AcrR family transcriptional repressor of mexJK operon
MISIVRRTVLTKGMSDLARSAVPARDDTSVSPARVAGRRGRPSRAEEREITETIVRTALQLFLADGYGATSMKRIAEAAGVAPNTLYARFPDKAALFRAIVEWKTAEWKVMLPARRPRPGTPLVEILECSALATLEAVDREDISAIGRMLAVETERFPELAVIYYESAMTIGRDDLIEQVAAACTPPLPLSEATDLVQTLFEAVLGHSASRRFHPAGATAVSSRTAARRIAQVLAHGWPNRR